MKLKIFITLSAIAFLTVIALSQIERKPFTPAEDFPRNALIYVQIADLPAFITLWNESNLSQKYTSSKNYGDFQNNHLGLKIAGRLSEFDAAAGFPIDPETVSKLANNQAAIAVYDIGKLEFVFAAPVSDEVFAATKFMRNKDKFTEETLGDGTAIYRATVEADRGRQKQELIYANVKGRFVLATSEKLLMQTINNINGGKTKNRLSDEPDFKNLSEKTVPHTATVWINQTALNDDYYFKRYWLMSNVRDLKNIRSGIFDLEIQEDKLIEKRRFLLNKNIDTAPVGKTQANETVEFLPENVPFYKLQRTDAKSIGTAIEQTIFERRPTKANETDENYYSHSDGYTSGDYEYLGEQFDETINETNGEKAIETPPNDLTFSEILQSADPQTILTFTVPKILPAPRFVEFRRAAVFNLAAPENFNRTAFESAIEKTFTAQILIASPNSDLTWKSANENNVPRRELTLPMLGQTAAYAVRGNKLILTNDADFLLEILKQPAQAKAHEIFDKPFSELTVIDLEQRKSAFDDVFAVLNEKKADDTFFTGNISSLLDSISDVNKIEIRKSFSSNAFEEELIFRLR